MKNEDLLAITLSLRPDIVAKLVAQARELVQVYTCVQTVLDERASESASEQLFAFPDRTYVLLAARYEERDNSARKNYISLTTVLRETQCIGAPLRQRVFSA